jgi:hypothetical protein
MIRKIKNTEEKDKIKYQVILLIKDGAYQANWYRFSNTIGY